MTMKQILPCCMCLFLVLAGDVQAGMPFESKAQALEGYRRHYDPIALVTLHEVRRVAQDEVERISRAGWLASKPHYVFRAKIVETLRGTPFKGSVDIPCTFVPLGTTRK